jgi:F-type H+-transporting ATPase subunit gamma
MSSTTVLKQRIKSIKSTKQITKAMELVSASKMRRAQLEAKKTRDYREAAYSILARLSSLSEVQSHPLLTKRKVKSRLYIVITSNGTLAGAYNYNVIKQFTIAANENEKNHIATKVIVIGKQGANLIRRFKNIDMLAVYPAFGDKPTVNDIRPILNTVIDEYREAKTDEVFLIYTMFVSNLVQKAQILSLLPAILAEEDKAKYKYDFTNFEPSIETVIENSITRLIEAQIWQGDLESIASEHSMRMLAMKNATDNASQLIDDFTLEFNTARQANITQELAEISGGVEALKDE